MRLHIFIGIFTLLMSLFSATSAEACSRKCCKAKPEKAEKASKKRCCTTKDTKKNICSSEKDSCPCGNTVSCSTSFLAIAPLQFVFPISFLFSSKPFEAEDSANFHYLNCAIIGFSGVIWQPPRV